MLHPTAAATWTRLHSIKPVRAGLASIAMLAAFVCVLLLPARFSAADNLVPVRLRIGGRDIACQPSCRTSGSEVYGPISVISELGLESRTDDNGDALIVTVPSTRMSFEIGMARIAGASMIPLSDLAKSIGAVLVGPGSAGAPGTVYILARITSVRVERGDLFVTTSFPVPYHVRVVPGVSPSRSYIDLMGAWAGSEPPTVPSNQTRITQLRTGQFTREVARIVAEFSQKVGFAETDNLRNGNATIVAQVINGVREPGKGQASDYLHHNPGQPAQPNSPSVAVGGTGSQEYEHPDEDDLLHQNDARRGRAQRDTEEAFRPSGRARELRNPGVLAGKTIVVDPGHGGTSTGALGHLSGSLVYEKNCTLAIALKLRDLLDRAGVKVIMTRESDVDVPLGERPRMANDLHADLFFSIHNDSNGTRNSNSGTTTYYHMGDPASHAMAVCVQDAVRAVTGLPSHGARSDGSLYASGLAVLRCTTMPAILCEVAYINNERDSRLLVDPDFQQRVAQAMFDGIRSYVVGSESVAHGGATRVSPASEQTITRPEHDSQYEH
jgi:N-acetylmuramoyl-L-alanine amidase